MIALLYIPIAMLLGWLNAYLVEKKGAPGKKKIIKHFWNGLLHFGAACLVYSFYMNGKHVDVFGLKLYVEGLKSAGSLLLIARVFFNESYNYFHIPRHPLGYISSTSRSWVDRFQYWLSAKGRIVPIIVLLLLTTVLLIA